MNNRKYIPRPQNYTDEHYATFEEMCKARPDVLRSMDNEERTAYRVENYE